MRYLFFKIIKNRMTTKLKRIFEMKAHVIQKLLFGRSLQTKKKKAEQHHHRSRSSCMSLQFIFRVSFSESFAECSFQLLLYLVNKLLPILILCITCPSFHFKFLFQCSLFQSSFKLV